LEKNTYMSESTLKHRINLTNVLSPTWNPHPEEVFRAISSELRPVPTFLAANHVAQECATTIHWICIELVTNAVNALFSHALIAKTGMSRNALLTVFAANPLWGEVALNHVKAQPSGTLMQVVEQRLSMPLEPFLTLPQKQKFASVGVFEAPHQIVVRCDVVSSTQHVVCDVRSPLPPTDEDLHEILARFHEPDATARTIQRQRAHRQDADGCYWLPSLTGGGGMGLLACLRKAHAADLSLTFLKQGVAKGETVFRLSSSGS
jgi:hypothetical protein